VVVHNFTELVHQTFSNQNGKLTDQVSVSICLDMNLNPTMPGQNVRPSLFSALGSASGCPLHIQQLNYTVVFQDIATGRKAVLRMPSPLMSHVITFGFFYSTARFSIFHNNLHHYNWRGQSICKQLTGESLAHQCGKEQ
jgi:hypothetical protein